MFKGSSIEFDESISPSTQYIVHILSVPIQHIARRQHTFFSAIILLYFHKMRRFILSLIVYMCNSKHNLFISSSAIFYVRVWLSGAHGLSISSQRPLTEHLYRFSFLKKQQHSNEEQQTVHVHAFYLFFDVILSFMK